MKLRPEQLAQHLQSATLQPIYLLTGDEPLQMMETADAIRAAAKQNGYDERNILEVARGFNWQDLIQQADSLSLFSSQKIIELRLGSSKPGADGGKALRTYAENPPEDTLLLITCDKLDQPSQKTKWFKALESAGVVVTIWPIDTNRLPQWIVQRFVEQGRTITQEAARYISDRVEGNMLAASQEVSILCLLTDTTDLDLDAVINVGDSSRFDVFKLIDAALNGDPTRTLRILDGLRSEGLEPIIVHWALHRELHALHAMAVDIAQGQPPESVLQKHRVWSSRSAQTRNALNRLNPPRLQQMLLGVSRIERLIKGASEVKLDPWSALSRLCIQLSGTRRAA